MRNSLAAEVRGERPLGRDSGGGCQRPIDLKTSQIGAAMSG